MTERHRDPWVSDALEFINVSELRVSANLLPAPPNQGSLRKAELVSFIAHSLEGAALEALWRSLKGPERTAVQLAVHKTAGRLDMRRLEALLGRKAVMTFKFDGRDLKDRLTLFFYPRSRHAPRTFMPEDLRTRLETMVPDLPRPTVPTIDDLPEYVEHWTIREEEEMRVPLHCRTTEKTAPHELVAVLRLVENGALRISDKSGQATAAARKVISSVLRKGDFYAPENERRHAPEGYGDMRAHAWPLLLQAAKLVQRRGTRLELTRKGRALLAGVSAEALRELLNDWLHGGTIDEFNRVDAIKGQRGKGKRSMTLPEERRDIILDALGECPVDSWIAFDDFSCFMRSCGYDFEITEDPWNLYLADPHHGSLGYDGAHSWGILQDRYILCFLFEYVATLGLVDVAYAEPEGARPDYCGLWAAEDHGYLSRYDGLHFFRINRLGAFCLEIEETYEPGEDDVHCTLEVLPGLAVRVEGEPSPEEETVLAAWAEHEGDGVWRLDRRKAVDAVVSGLSTDDFTAFLKARDDQPLPEKVEGFLVEIRERARALRHDGTAFVIECADAATADLIAADRSTSRLCERLGAKGLVVRSAAEARFRKAVQAMGYGLAP